jgi:hypothetical protein
VGDLMMALIVVTETNPREAIVTMFRRCAILLIPMSIGIYTLALPFLLRGGFRPFINCLVKLRHHLGRFSALCGRPILRERKR